MTTIFPSHLDLEEWQNLQTQHDYATLAWHKVYSRWQKIGKSWKKEGVTCNLADCSKAWKVRRQCPDQTWKFKLKNETLLALRKILTQEIQVWLDLDIHNLMIPLREVNLTLQGDHWLGWHIHLRYLMVPFHEVNLTLLGDGWLGLGKGS